MDAGDELLSMMGQYPVINLSLKSARQPRFFDAFWKLCEDIIREIDRHEYLARAEWLLPAQKAAFQGLYDAAVHRSNLVRLLDEDPEEQLLKKEILVDEYDESLLEAADDERVEHNKAVFKGFFRR